MQVSSSSCSIADHPSPIATTTTTHSFRSTSHQQVISHDRAKGRVPLLHPLGTVLPELLQEGRIVSPHYCRWANFWAVKSVMLVTTKMISTSAMPLPILWLRLITSPSPLMSSLIKSSLPSSRTTMETFVSRIWSLSRRCSNSATTIQNTWFKPPISPFLAIRIAMQVSCLASLRQWWTKPAARSTIRRSSPDKPSPTTRSAVASYTTRKTAAMNVSSESASASQPISSTSWPRTSTTTRIGQRRPCSPSRWRQGLQRHRFTSGAGIRSANSLVLKRLKGWGSTKTFLINRMQKRQPTSNLP